ncbi:MAG TPA: peptidylprolyl isomerase [Polyangiaceae bacterium]|nr:peptidylprolyl isomerase [Polyangiaceae bacterium]
MQIAKDCAVAIEYTLTDDEGKVIDTSTGRSPLWYLHGHENIVPGLEKALTGKSEGDKLKVSVPPEEGYGTYDESRTFEVPRSELPPTIQPEKGMELTMHGPGGHGVPVVVLKVKLNSVILDGNHPLAGKTLHFEVEVASVRKAKKEELSHGHVHGPGGHHH